jgi:TolB-like protein/tRNA A-37 threonylcarbamoyl transferase component Bud32
VAGAGSPEMKKNKWKRVGKIFHAALDLPAEKRKAYLQKVCAGDSELFSEVESLINNHEKESHFLEEPVFELGLGALHKNGQKSLAGMTIDSYELQEKIGAGGMGEVYKAFEVPLKRHVALKFLCKSLENDHQAKRQLVKEAQAAAALEHSNICTVYGIRQFDERHFIVMQYIEGKTLADFIERETIDVEKFKSFARQILTAVDFAHSHSIIHRDLKPGNIMLTNEERIKVLDFGLAKVIRPKPPLGGETDSKSNFSQNGLILGTVSYMSPEQLRGEKIDYQSDIFSVGIILYELLTKKNPFTRKSQAETIAAILYDEPPALETLAPDFPASLVCLVEKCLQKKPDDRFQSAAEILVELDKTEIKNFKWLKRVFVRAAFAAVILLAVLTGLYFYDSRYSKRKLAVLPISYDALREEKKYLAYGLTQEIIEKLSHLSDLDVKNESLIARYKGKTIEPLAAGRELNVDAVVVGTVEQNAEELILITNIVRTLDGVVIDNYRWRIEETNIIELPENIALRITDKIQSKLTNEDKHKLDKNDTESVEAKNLYLKGRFYLKRNDIKDAILAFTEAKDIDQNFAKAWAGLADAYLAKAAPGVEDAITPDDAVKWAREAANKAIDLDNTQGDSYNSLGLINLRYGWKWNEAETYFKMAIERDPEFLPAHLGLMNVLINQRRFDEAMTQAQKIKEVDPFSVSSDIQIALIYYQKNDYEQTDRILTDLLQKYPDVTRVKYLQAYQFLKTQRLKEALDILEPIYSSNKVEDKIYAAAPLGFAYAKMNRREDALRIIQDLQEFKNRKDKIYVPAQETALIYVGLGDYDKVFEFLNKSCDEKFSSLPNWINEPIVDEIKNDSRFAGIRQCVNL